MKEKTLIVSLACIFSMQACVSSGPAQVEQATAILSVGDTGLLVDGFEITVSNPRSVRHLKASDFDIKNNVPQGFVDPSTGKAPEDYDDDGIVLSHDKNKLIISCKPFPWEGKMGERFRRIPWELHCAADTCLNLTPDKITDRRTVVLDDCIKGSFTYAGLTREYMLYLPKDKDGKEISNVPLLVWQIGGGEYDKDLMTVATANRCLVSLPTQGIPCATLVFAIANPNYSYSASLHPDRIELIDRNNALQMAFIDRLIAEGKVDGSKLFCAGASSGGGCTIRFMMQFADRFKAAIPCCAMDPVVPIHQVEEKYDGQFADDIEKAWKMPVVYKWNGSDMILSEMDIDAFVKLPMYFVHAETDRTCKVASSYAYKEARHRLGAQDDRLLVYSDEDMLAYGLPPMLAHFSWVPLLDDYSKGSPMDWLTDRF